MCWKRTVPFNRENELHIHNQLMAKEEGSTPHTHQSANYTSQFTSMNEMEQTCTTFFSYNIQKNLFEDS